MSTIDRALSLLDHFSSTKPEIGLSELNVLSGFDKGTVHRYLKSLKNSGFLEQEPTSRSYRLGPALLRLAHVREATVPISKIVSTHVEALASETQELVHASVCQAKGMSTISIKDGGIRGTRVGFDISEVLPLHATSSGIAMLAFGPHEILDALEKHTLESFTSATVTSFEDILELVKTAREDGYAYTNQTYETEVSSVAVPFFNGSTIAAGTLAIATPSSRMDASVLKKMASAAMETGYHITRDLGGQVPTSIQEKWALVQRAKQEA